MLIGWATPFNYRSAIGKFSRAVCEELSERGHEVTIVRLETGPELTLEALDTTLPSVSAENVDIDAFDKIVVNFGNHAPYHSQCVSLIARRAPLGIFHDAEMRDFEWGLQGRHGVGIPRLPGYSMNAAGVIGDLVAAEARPLLASLAAMCWGAVIHGPHYRATIDMSCPGPVETIPLCYPDPGKTREPLPPAEGRRVIIFGVINEHKQPRRVMRAISALREPLGRIELHLAGAIEDRYRSELLKEAKALGIDPPVLHGYVSDEALQELIENSHAVCVLRYPVTEGGSASLATALYRQRPIIMADIASYAIVPDEFAYKVSYGEDPDDVARALVEIFEDPGAAELRARKVRAWAEDRLSAHSYVDALLPLLQKNNSSARVAQLARDLVPAMTDPQHHAITSAATDVARVLDWMSAAQNAPNE